MLKPDVAAMLRAGKANRRPTGPLSAHAVFPNTAKAALRFSDKNTRTGKFLTGAGRGNHRGAFIGKYPNISFWHHVLNRTVVK